MALFRRTLRAHSWIALAAFLSGWLLPVSDTHPIGQDDAACVIIGGSDGSSAQQIAAPAADQDEPAHCVVCHIARAMSGAISSDVTRVAAPIVAAALSPLSDNSPRTVTSAPPSSRGPPAIL